MKTFKRHSALKKGLIIGLSSALVLGSTVAVFAATGSGNNTDETTAETVGVVVTADAGEEAANDEFEFELDDDYDYEDEDYSDEEYDYSDEDYDWCDEDCEIDYGNITDEEIAELESIYDQMWDVWDSIFPEDLDSISDEEFDALYEQYEEAIKDLDAQALVYEVKAGWYGDLTVDEVNELFDIYDQMDDIWYSIFPEDIDDLSDEEFDTLYEQYEEAAGDIEEKAEVLEEKAGWYCEEDDCSEC